MGTTPGRWQTDDQLTTLFISRPHLLFRHPRQHLGVGGATPKLICSPIVIEFRNKGKQNAWDVLNPIIPDFPTFGLILTLPGQVKKGCFLVSSTFLQITVELRKVENGNTIVFLASRRIET